jgi:exodeoxyribonuclease-3
MRLITWNVNGLRAVLKKGFSDFCASENADCYCIQETKMQLGQAEVDLPNYNEYWNSAVRKGYSGTAVFSRPEPLSVAYDIGAEGHDDEGRSITVEYNDFYLVNEYTPNAQDGLARIDYRMSWEDARREYLRKLDAKKPVILCGDLNVAHEEIDLKNPKSNRGNAGFSDEERGKFGELLAAGFTDSFRYLYPDLTGAYTWWSYRFNARANNAGWRIDYFIVSNRLAAKIKDVVILKDVYGSDHCPVRLEVDVE